MPTERQNKGAAPRDGETKGRLSPAMRRAITLRVEKALTIGDACKLAGVSEAGYHKAMLKPTAQAFAQAIETRLLAKVAKQRELNRSRAYDIAEQLLMGATTAQEKWKAVEFWTRGDGQTPSVQVNIGAQTGYEYVRPGARIVDVTPSDDTGN